jgi:endonuclease-3
MSGHPNALKILELLEKEYPRAPKTALRYRSPLEMLVSTILSAQCTDARVNIVTRDLFGKYRRVEDYAGADIKELEQDIKSTGFYRNKARNIKAAADMIVREYGGKVPDTMDDLLLLPGVARKTANIVLFNAFNKVDGIAVDTHVRRLSYRMGLTGSKDPVKIEQDLMNTYPRGDWGDINRVFVEHGRRVCAARKALCGGCVVAGLCPRVGV